jgi:hypothetical protein
MKILFSEAPNEQTISDLISGDAVLWLTDSDYLDGGALVSIARLIDGPWRGVFLESSSGALATALADGGQERWGKETGFTHIISSNPISLILQKRARPVFFLNGRGDFTGSDGVLLNQTNALLRRLNMISRMRELEPKRILIVGPNPGVALNDLAELWDDGLRALISVVSAESDASSEVLARLVEATDLDAVAWITQSSVDFSETVCSRASALANDGRISVNIRLPSGRRSDIDFATAELIENPISDACRFILARDILPVSPRDLTLKEFRGFFTKTDADWRAFSAGLPWMPDPSPERIMMKEMRRLLSDPPGAMQLFSVTSEPGAGGTTQAYALAFAAAREGYPVIIVKPHSEVPSSLELTGFMFRAISVIEERSDYEQGAEPVWLVVLDVEHLSGSPDDLWRLWADLARSGRRVALLKVVGADNPLQAPTNIPHKELVYVNHDLAPNDVISLGDHINVFLRHVGKEKPKGEWKAFWDAHRPDIDTGLASFWIALEFWLAGYMELGESIQSWVLRQFKSLDASVETKQALLEIAALSVERRAVPERLLMQLRSPRLPWAQVLEDTRGQSPGLGLAQAQSVPYGRVWAIAHDVLARYLINGVWNDRPLAARLGLDNRRDAVDLRLELISRVAHRSSIGEPFALPFAINLATRVLKLDEQSGNAEFFPYWERVLALLEGVPVAVSTGSRTYNHHLAISRRRITQGEIFQVTSEEKRALLLRAVNDVSFALDNIDSTPDDESDLNLLNTLALLYQDLATLERLVFGDKIRLANYLAMSDEVTRRALKENPNNPYVLETAAKNLLRQDFDADEERRVQAAAEALSYVFQASALESGLLRQSNLGQLAMEALKLLRAPSAQAAVDYLCSIGSAYGYVARAWRLLPHEGALDDVSWKEINPANALEASEILNQAPQRNWLLVRLQYDFMVIAEPMGFSRQLALLDELADFQGYRLPLQQRLERAVLLYLQGRHKAGTAEFSRLRQDIRLSQAILFVPERLRWLLSSDKTRRAVCSARVIDSSSGRPHAKVVELSGAQVPFTPQEFGKARMATTEIFKCQVTFSAMGPFLKPVDFERRVR